MTNKTHSTNERTTVESGSMRGDCAGCGKNRVPHWAMKCSTCIARESSRPTCQRCGDPVARMTDPLCDYCSGLMEFERAGR